MKQLEGTILKYEFCSCVTFANGHKSSFRKVEQIKVGKANDGYSFTMLGSSEETIDGYEPEEWNAIILQFGKALYKKDVDDYMEKHQLTWHENENGRTMMKVPTLIHQNVPHNGGVNAVKREAIACADYESYDSYFITEKKQSPAGPGNDLENKNGNKNNGF